MSRSQCYFRVEFEAASIVSLHVVRLGSLKVENMVNCVTGILNLTLPDQRQSSGDFCIFFLLAQLVQFGLNCLMVAVAVGQDCRIGDKPAGHDNS